MTEPTPPDALHKLDADWIAEFVAGLPDSWSPHRRGLLPGVLAYWSNSVIDEYNCARKLTKSNAPEIARDHLQQVHKAAEHLNAALETAFHAGSTDFMARYAGPKGRRLDDLHNSVSDILLDLNWLIDVTSAASVGLKRGRGRPTDLIRLMIISDIAALFEWVSGIRATRRLNSNTTLNEGPFWDFARKIWVEVVGKDNHQFGEPAELGLQSAVRSYAEAGPEERRSPLLINVDLHYRNWLIFDP